MDQSLREALTFMKTHLSIPSARRWRPIRLAVAVLILVMPPFLSPAARGQRQVRRDVVADCAGAFSDGALTGTPAGGGTLLFVQRDVDTACIAFAGGGDPCPFCLTFQLSVYVGNDPNLLMTLPGFPTSQDIVEACKDETIQDYGVMSPVLVAGNRYQMQTFLQRGTCDQDLFLPVEITTLIFNAS
jgi:hypothetical protein